MVRLKLTYFLFQLFYYFEISKKMNNKNGHCRFIRTVYCKNFKVCKLIVI